MRRTVGWVQSVFWTTGIAALGYSGYVLAESRLAQSRGDRELDRFLAAAGPKSGGDTAPPGIARGRRRTKSGDLVGRLEVVRLGMSVIVFEGTGPQVLEVGAGHLPGSPLPGERGNVVVAGHRDTFFRDLRHIEKGDLIRVTTGNAAGEYQVQSTRIVNPDEVGVLAPTPVPSLTLVTCYPFSYIGPAPRRFVVRAAEIPGGLSPHDGPRRVPLVETASASGPPDTDALAPVPIRASWFRPVPALENPARLGR